MRTESKSDARANEDMKRIAVVIPSYKVTRHILDVIARIGPEVDAIYVVDDACPDGSGAFVQRECKDSRVRVLFNDVNLGVGGAVMHGYRVAASDGFDCLVKIDGDGQMDPRLLKTFAAPILRGEADYTKGNRFHRPEDVSGMPLVRLIGNAGLSFMTKVSTGYWQLFDPTNGYTAISSRVVAHLPLDKVSKRYFFESDLLFRLGTIRAVVQEIPMKAVYADEVSNLKVSTVLPQFAMGHLRNFIKRIYYGYYLRGFSVASVELILGLIFVTFGVIFGSIEWWKSIEQNRYASSGIVMIAALPVVLGVQLLLSFLHFDVASEPSDPITKRLPESG